MSFSWTRVGAIFQKEIRDYRRNRFTIVFTMAVLPLIFVTLPMIQLFAANASTTSAKLDSHIGLSLLYLLDHPGHRSVGPGRLLRRRRARAGDPRTGADHPDPPGGVPGRQGPRSARPHPHRRLRHFRDLPGRGCTVRPSHHRHRRIRAFTRLGPAPLHPAACRVVDLGRHRHLHRVAPTCAPRNN